MYRDVILLKFNSTSDKDIANMLFICLDVVKLRKLLKVMDYTMRTIRKQQIGAMNPLQNLHLRCLQNNVQIENGEKEKWVEGDVRWLQVY